MSMVDCIRRDGASLHPARLVRGLARAVEARGGVIYEQTPVTEFKARKPDHARRRAAR